MTTLDWIVLGMTVSIIIGYGIYKTRGSKNIESYLLGDNEAKWWTVGLSVMATQASAITFLSTPGQAYHDGMGFAQFYFMLPVAMIIICITFIPLFYKLKVYTAYEFLESRFDLKTRSLTSGLFLIQRGLATGITIYAPSIILSSIMGWNLNVTTIFIGLLAVIYTVSGGTKAVHVTHKHQMIVILTGLFIIFFILLDRLSNGGSFSDAMLIAAANQKLDVIDFTFDWNERYNIWSSMAALFLFLSYFGTDQSQVQRYITGRSIRESRIGLLLNGLMKVPLQFFILFLGVMVFLFYQTHKAPIFFNEKVNEKLYNSEYADIYNEIEEAYNENFDNKQNLHASLYEAARDNDHSRRQALETDIRRLTDIEMSLRSDAKTIIKQYDSTIETNDKDYVFVNFIIHNLPKGLVGLLLAVIFFAAMSSTASELNALASTSVVDIYKRNIFNRGSDKHYVHASKLLTLFWGLVAILFASVGTLFENLIQFVNIVGSIFYGTILGIFLVAFYFKKIRGHAVFFAGLIVEAFVIYLFFLDIVPYLWLNVVGALGVIILAHFLQLIMGKKNGLKPEASTHI